MTHSGLGRLRIAAVQPFPGPVADVAPNTDLQNNRFSPADCSASKRNNTRTRWQPSHCGGSSHDPTDRHDGRTKSHADEGALSEALSAARETKF